MTPGAVLAYIVLMISAAGLLGQAAYLTLCYIFQTDGTSVAVLGGLIGALAVAFIDLKFTRPR